MADRFLRIAAHTLSILFHPLFLVSYSLIFLLLVNPYLFGASRWSDRTMLLILVFISSFLIPIIAIILMRMLGMVDSISIQARENRTGPFIITSILYLWLFINLKNQPDIPTAFVVCILGAVLSLFACFFVNIFKKLSVHAAGMGAMLVFAFIVRLNYSYGAFAVDIPGLGVQMLHLNFILPFLLLLAGAVMSSRLVLKVHTIGEVGLGFGVGTISQIIAFQVIGG